MEKEFLRELYGHYKDDEKAMIELLHGNLKFFSGVIVTLIGSGVLFFSALIKDGKIEPFIAATILIIFGLFVIGFSHLGNMASKSVYRRQLESIVKRAKIEDLFDLANSSIYGGKIYWKEEGLILSRYLEDKLGYDPYYEEPITNNKTSSSKDFVEERLSQGFMKVTKRLFILTRTIGFVSVLTGVGLLISDFYILL